MDNSPWNHVALLWVQLYRAVLEVHDEHSVNHIKKLIDFVMLVPVVVAFNHSNSDD